MSANVNENDAVLGYYQPFFLFAHVKQPLEDLITPPIELVNKLSDEQLFRYALTRYTYLHEIRHFHDYFGTIAGISLFNAHIQQLRAFATFIDIMRSAGIPLELPFTALLQRDDEIGKVAQGLIRNWRIFSDTTLMFAAPHIKTTSNFHHPNEHVVYKTVEISGAAELPDVPTFPRSMHIKRGGTITPLTLYYPIGLDVLIEGTAQALQRGIMEFECPDTLVKRLIEQTERPLDPSRGAADQMLAGSMPYNISDLLVSKYLRLRGYPRFERQSLIQLTDLALSYSYIEPVSKPWEVPATYRYTAVGGIFLEFLEDTPIQELVSGEIKYPEETKTLYQNFLERILVSKKPDEIPYATNQTTDLISPIDKIEAVVSHHIIAPLIQARLDTNHAVFFSFEEYFGRLMELPQLPALVEGDHIRHAEYMQGHGVGDAWAKYCLLSQTMHEMLTGKEYLSCFRAEVIPNCELNLCLSGDCNSNIKAGQCEKWIQERALPECLFASLIRRFGLSNDSSHN